LSYLELLRKIWLIKKSITVATVVLRTEQQGLWAPADLIIIIIIEFVERRDDRRYRGAGVATLRIRGGKIVSFQMASKSKQRVARPAVGLYALQ